MQEKEKELLQRHKVVKSMGTFILCVSAVMFIAYIPLAKSFVQSVIESNFIFAVFKILLMLLMFLFNIFLMLFGLYISYDSIKK